MMIGQPTPRENAMLRLPIRALLAGLLAAPALLHAAATRTHVASTGSDANTAFSCDAAHPCRTFAAALGQTSPGGEILAMDSAGYGKVVIDRSVTIVAAPGAFAGIGVGAGGNATGVEIATAGVDVVLRGLTITGQGGLYGISMAQGASLSVENCVIAGFSGASHYAMRILAAAQVRVLDSVVRQNYRGFVAQGGARVSIARSRFLDNTQVGISIWGNADNTSTIAAVTDSVVSGSSWGLGADAVTSPTTTALLTVLRTTVSNNTRGIYATSGGNGIARVAVAGSTVTGNATGLFRQVIGAGNATLHSTGGNAVTENGTDAAPGTVTALPPV